MKDIVFKVTPKGEGKTKWLIDIAKKYHDLGKKVFLYTEDEKEYGKFCEKYFKTFSEVCPVNKLTAFIDTVDSIILIDDLFNCACQIGNIKFMQRNCYKMFITLEGTTQDTEELDALQLSIFD